MSKEINHDRRRLLGSAAMAIAAVPLGRSSSKLGLKPSAIKQASTSVGPPKQIDAGLLNVGYAESGPVDGPPVVLLHGWPYDIHSYVDVAPLLSAKGYRVIGPYLRG